MATSFRSWQTRTQGRLVYVVDISVVFRRLRPTNSITLCTDMFSFCECVICMVVVQVIKCTGFFVVCVCCIYNYNDVIMTMIASQITSLTVVYSTVYSDANQRKHQSYASLAFVWGIHRDRWIPRTKGQLRGKCFHLMTSSWSSPDESRDWFTHILLG